MKVLLAYDGSTYADAAIADLSRAGFPRDTELMIASVADFTTGRPTVSEFDLISAASRRLDAVLDKSRHFEARVLEEAQLRLSRVVHELRRKFPDWKIDSKILTGMPAEELLRFTNNWNPNLIVSGSHGRSAIGRFFLGSVSKSLAEEATSSIRVVRRGFEKANGEPIEILLGAKTPAEAERVIDAVNLRRWPDDTRVRLVAIDDVSAKSNYEALAKRLAAIPLTVSLEIESVDPKWILLQAAEEARADAIFVAGDSNGGLDETASGLITSPKFTVEIVR